MEIADLHIEEQGFDLFLNLQPKDKIKFLDDISTLGYDTAVATITPEPYTTTSKAIVNDLFQDTVYETMESNDDTLTVLIINQTIHLNSSSLKWIRKMVTKLWMDGHILIRNKFAKKIPGIDNFRYYRCYDIIGQSPPICLS